MAPKKAAKKKAAKKSGSGARKAFEHLGRVQSIAHLAPAEGASLATLVKAADAAFQSHRHEESAHLLRAAEHLLFAAIVETNPAQVSPDLSQALHHEFNHLLERAADHGERKKSPQAIRRIYLRMSEDAASAMRKRHYRKALELARGAEALCHIERFDPELPEPGEKQKRLKA